MEANVQEAALAVIYDPETVRQAVEAGEGAVIDIALGGKLEMAIASNGEISSACAELFKRTGVTVVNCLSVPECAGIISVERNEYRREGSSGMPIVGGLIKILGKSTVYGEICYKGLNLMLGYFGDEAESDAAFDSDGYYLTGIYGKLMHNEDETWIFVEEKNEA